MNILKSELRFSTSFRNGKVTNKGEWADFAHFNPWLPWQRPLNERKKRFKSVICDNENLVKIGPVDPEIICVKGLF